MSKISTTAEINGIILKDQATNRPTPATGYTVLFSKFGEIYAISTSGLEGPFGVGSVGTGDVVGPAGATDGHVALFDGATGKLIKDGGVPLTAGHTIADEATPLTQRATLNFVGDGVAVTDDAGNNRTVVTISGAVAAAVKHQVVFTVSSGVSLNTGLLQITNEFGSTATLSRMSLRVPVPASGDLTADLNVNGTTVFTTQSNRPVIASGAVYGFTTTFDDTTWGNGEYLTMDVDAVGVANDLVAVVVFTI